MRTLFLNPPSYAGFDGGAGARYQARREIRSYWYPTWLAQPAAIVPGSKLVDAPPAGLALGDVVPLARRSRPGRCCTRALRHSPATSRWPRRSRRRTPRCWSASSGPRWRWSPSARCWRRRPSTSWPGRNSTSPSPRWPRAARWPRSTASATGTATARWCTTPTGEILEDMDRLPFVTPVYKRDLRRRGLLHRLPAAPVRVAVHRAGVPVAVHVLPVAADRGRPPVPDPQRRARAGRGRAGPGAVPAGEGAVLRRRHVHRRPAAGPRPIARGLGRLGITWSCNAKANVPSRDAEGAAGQRAAPAAGGLRVRATSRSSSTSRRACGSSGPGGSPPTAGSWASPCTARSSLACPARPGRPSRRRSGSPGRSTRTRSRSRSPRPTLAPSCTGRRWRTAGCPATTTRPRWSASDGTQLAALSYPHLGHTEILESVDAFYRRFYFRAGKLAEMSAETAPPARAWPRRRLREGGEFVRFLNRRARTPAGA